jgi:hypothetical protein
VITAEPVSYSIFKQPPQSREAYKSSA